ncbi:Phage integrase family protein [Priestia megaterium Q3]|uniref:Phage integrase family protein n=1 Tax=Priestia megaterium Q3 TaxID=1452722 RepID=A0A806TGA7_PRIMG|nr:site-specific integrase [Priestia megaterium]AKP77170.1 Phage integrase family protein [Priestia megaterium Q3]
MENINGFNYENLEDMPDYSDDEFDIINAISLANLTIKELTVENIWLSQRFEEDMWALEANKETFQKTYIDFNEISDSVLKIQLKCWAVLLLKTFRPSTVRNHIHNVVKIIVETNGLDASKIQWIEDIISQIPESMRSVVLSSTINFLDYTSNSQYEPITNEIRDIKRKYPTFFSIRTLPPYLDVLRFSYILLSAANKWNKLQKTKFLPILIWWKLTTIIPMRASEFVSLKRNCASFKLKTTGNYNSREFYITLPRRKQKATTKRLSVPDTLPITEDIYNLISEYIKLTEPYGDSETLISYRAYSRTNTRPSTRRSLNEKFYNLSPFHTLLNQFYDEVIKETGLEVISKKEWLIRKENELINRENERLDFEQPSNYIVKINPNDTRHFAICNMMLQGMNSLTIARMAGHQHIETQYNYQAHLEYFVDSRVYELTLLNDLRKNINFGREDFHSTLSIKDARINSLKNYDVSKFSEEDEVEIGYCTDSLKRCEASVCILCSKNWIPPYEIDSHLKELIGMKQQSRKKIKIATKTLIRIYKEMNIEYKTERINPKDTEDLKRAAKQVNSYIHDYSIILAKLGIGEF